MSKEVSSFESRVREIPLMEFWMHGEKKGVLKMRIEYRRGGFHVAVVGEGATRVGRSLPDWPEALSLRPDVGKRRN